MGNSITINIPEYLTPDITYAWSKSNFQETCLAFIDEKYWNWKQEDIQEILNQFNEWIDLYIWFLKDSYERNWNISDKEKELFLKLKKELFYIENIINKFAWWENEWIILRRWFSFAYSNKNKCKFLNKEDKKENNELYEFKTDLDLIYLWLMFEKEEINNNLWKIKFKYKSNEEILKKIKWKLKNDFNLFLLCNIKDLENKRNEIITKLVWEKKESNNYYSWLNFWSTNNSNEKFYQIDLKIEDIRERINFKENNTFIKFLIYCFKTKGDNSFDISNYLEFLEEFDSKILKDSNILENIFIKLVDYNEHILKFIKEKDLLNDFIDTIIVKKKIDENILEFLKKNDTKKFNEYLEYYKDDKDKYLKYISFKKYELLLLEKDFIFYKIVSIFFENKYLYNENITLYNFIILFNELYRKINKDKKWYFYELTIYKIFDLLSENKEICILFFKDLIKEENKEIFDFIFNKDWFDIFWESKYWLKNKKDKSLEIIPIYKIINILSYLDWIKEFEEIDFFKKVNIERKKSKAYLLNISLKNNKNYKINSILNNLSKLREITDIRFNSLNLINIINLNLIYFKLFLKFKWFKKNIIKCKDFNYRDIIIYNKRYFNSKLDLKINNENLKLILLNYNFLTKYKINEKVKSNSFYTELVRKIINLINNYNKNILSNIIISFIKNNKIQIEYLENIVIWNEIKTGKKYDKKFILLKNIKEKLWLNTLNKITDNILSDLKSDFSLFENKFQVIKKYFEIDIKQKKEIFNFIVNNIKNILKENKTKEKDEKKEKENKIKNFFSLFKDIEETLLQESNLDYAILKDLLIYIFDKQSSKKIKRLQYSFKSILKYFINDDIIKLQSYIRNNIDNYKDNDLKIDEDIQSILNYFKEPKIENNYQIDDNENQEKSETIYNISKIFNFLYWGNETHEATKRETYNFIDNQDSGSCLFTWYRWVGKTSMIKSIISNINDKNEFEYKNEKIIPIVINMPSLKKVNWEEYSKEQILNILIRWLYREIKKVKNISKKLLDDFEEQYLQTFNTIEKKQEYTKERSYEQKEKQISSWLAYWVWFVWLTSENFSKIIEITKWDFSIASDFKIQTALLNFIWTLFAVKYINFKISEKYSKTIINKYNDEIAEYNLNNSLNSINEDITIGKKINDLINKCTFFFSLELKLFQNKREKENMRYNYSYSLVLPTFILAIFTIFNLNIYINLIIALFLYLLFTSFIWIKYIHDEKELFSIKNTYRNILQSIKNLFIQQNTQDKIIKEKPTKKLNSTKISYLEILQIQLSYIRNLTKFWMWFWVFIIAIIWFVINSLNLNWLQSNILWVNYSNIVSFSNWFYILYIALLSWSIILYDKFYKILAIPWYLIDYFIDYFITYITHTTQYKIVFIIDELDKVISVEKNHFKQKEMMEKIFDVLWKLKILFFDTSNSLFFVVANKTAYDYYIQSKSQEDDLISNIFNKALYLPMREKSKFRFNHEIKIDINEWEETNTNNIMDYYYYTSHANFRKLTFNLNQELQVEEIDKKKEYFLNFDDNQQHTTKYYDFFNMIDEILEKRHFYHYDCIKWNKDFKDKFIENFIKNIKKRTENSENDDIYKNILETIANLKIEFSSDEKENKWMNEKRKRNIDSKIKFLNNEFLEITQKDPLKLEAYIYESIEKIVWFYNEKSNKTTENKEKNKKQYINIVYRDTIMNLLLNTMENIRTYRKLEISRLLDKLNLWYDDVMYPAFDDFVIIWLPLMSYYYETRELTVFWDDLISNK